MNEAGKADNHALDPAPELQQGLVESLTSAYAMLLKTQRTASSAYVRWTKAHTRSHEFAWLDAGNEILLMGGGTLLITPDSRVHPNIQKMMATMELNPYERELQYGYPYVIGKLGDTTFRAPLLTIPVGITTEGGNLAIRPTEDAARFNSLPFRAEADSGARELAFRRLMEQCPDLPLTKEALRLFCESVSRELEVRIDAQLNGDIHGAPDEPRGQMALKIVDHAACFIAPKTSYFLVSDLEAIGNSDPTTVTHSALGWLIGKRPAEPTSDGFSDRRKTFYPFPSNPSQRRVAQLVDDPSSRITVVQGPPGTGKSLTIANLACHLVAQGKKVLITSQKDKALQVVDETLRRLELDELPMTLLRRDRESRKQLRERLDSIQKSRSADETRQRLERQKENHEKSVQEILLQEELLRRAVQAEHSVEIADRRVERAPGHLSRLLAKWSLHRSLHSAERNARTRSDVVGDRLVATRTRLRAEAAALLEHAADHRVSCASKPDRNHLREFAQLLGRNQTNAKNFRVFDKLKNEPERCQMLLNILPCWIMAPDDVARLFPCSPEIFDVVIIDEASQCDLPSMVPVLYRAKQAVVAGDSMQMQAQRFAFTSGLVATQAWAQFGIDRFDPDGWLDPTKVDLLQLASIRMDEEAFLDEHYRSLPDIIGFSNDHWYRGKLRIMRDAEDRRFGDPTNPTVSLHRVAGSVAIGTQENEVEARALVEHLREMLEHPAYSNATFGVICLFEQQMQLVNDLVAEVIDEDLRADHDLVVVNPDGFQGDERDVILYSLSYDASGMERAQLSARQQDRPHIQGMLNVAFTRARDEMHIFHSAGIAEYGMSSGEGSIKDWLEYCSSCQQATPSDLKALDTQVAKAQSGFEQQVLSALASRQIEVIAQFPSCGYFIDIVAQNNGARIAVECDGEIWHQDVHGEPKIEDIGRQEVLERAGWRVVRIPYRSWRENPEAQVKRILMELENGTDLDDEHADIAPHTTLADGQVTNPVPVNNHEKAIVDALRDGARSRGNVYRMAREALGYGGVGSVIRKLLDDAVSRLESIGAISVEEDEIFFRSQETRDADYKVLLPPPERPEKPRQRTNRRWRGCRW